MPIADFNPIVLAVLTAAMTFSLSASTQPTALFRAIQHHHITILLTAIGLVLLTPVTLFYFLSSTSDATLAITLISISTLPAIGLVHYFVWASNGSMPIALWATFIALGFAAFLTPILVPIWTIAAPEIVNAIPSLHDSTTPLLESMLWVYVTPVVAGSIFRLSAPVPVAKVAPYITHAAVLGYLLYSILTLPFSKLLDISDASRHVSGLMFFCLLTVIAIFYAFALNIQKEERITIIIMVPSKLVMIPLSAAFVSEGKSPVDTSLLLTWSVIQYLFAAIIAWRINLAIRGRASIDPPN